MLENAPQQGDKDDNGFDTDVALATGELMRLIPDLVAALDGPLKRDAPVAPTLAPTAEPTASVANEATATDSPPW